MIIGGYSGEVAPMNGMARKVALVAVCALGLFVTVADAEEIIIGGGGAAIAGIFKPIKPHFEKATGIGLILLQSTPKDGLVDLIKGKVDAAVGAVPLESMIKGAVSAGVKVDAAKLHREGVGKNRTLLYMHPSNKMEKLTKEQVKGIFTGKIVNWNEVGGDDKEIIVVWGIGTPGQNSQFTKEVLDGETIARDVLETINYSTIKKTVAATPEAIGIDPHSLADASVKCLEQNPEMSSPIITVTMGKPSAKVQKLIDFIRGEGKKYL